MYEEYRWSWSKMSWWQRKRFLRGLLSAWQYGTGRGRLVYCSPCDRLVRQGPQKITRERYVSNYVTKKEKVRVSRQRVCGECGEAVYGGYTCPRCNCSSRDDWDYDEERDEVMKPSYLVFMSEMVSVYSDACWNALDWDETWLCHVCGEIYSFANGNC